VGSFVETSAAGALVGANVGSLLVVGVSDGSTVPLFLVGASVGNLAGGDSSVGIPRPATGGDVAGVGGTSSVGGTVLGPEMLGGCSTPGIEDPLMLFPMPATNITTTAVNAATTINAPAQIMCLQSTICWVLPAAPPVGAGGVSAEI